MTPTLFDPPPYAPDSATSYAAAGRIEPRAATLRGQVLAQLRACGEHGATREELETSLNLNGSTLRPRVWELLKAGLVYVSSVKRPTRSGCEADVLRATEARTA